MNSAEQIAEILLSINAVKISMNPPFTWTSGIKSPIYCDNRMLISHVPERNIVIEGFKKIIREQGFEPDVIGGTATAAIPWAAFVAHELELPMIYIRPEKKGHGAGKQIEGDLPPGKKVLIVEDLISTGGSSIVSAQVVRDEGHCPVTEVLAIVTYELEKAKQAFSEADLELFTLTNFSTLGKIAVTRGAISTEQYEKVLDFAKDPGGWADRAGV